MDFIEYVVAELKHGRLSKTDVLELLRQFSRNARAEAPTPVRALHPLLHRNLSDLYRQCYGSTFDGSEFFLDAHQLALDGAAPLKVLPAVAYLEMARAAVADALPGLDPGAVLRIDDVVWLRPLVAGPGAEVLIVLSAGAVDGAQAQEIEFEVVSSDSDAAHGDGVRVHCRGVARVAAEQQPRLDLDALKARMRAGRLEAAAIYPAYRNAGMRFGSAHQAIEWVLRGTGEALAQLALPEAAGATLNAFCLHPSLLDGALQASIGLLDSLEALPLAPSLPFALDALQIFAACTPRMYAWIRHAAGATSARLDIDLCDDSGKLCASLRGFASRPLAGDVVQRTAAPHGLVVARPVWRAAQQEPSPADDGSQHHVLLGALPGVQPDELRDALSGAICRALPNGDVDEASRYTEAALACSETLRALIADPPQAGAFVQLVIADTFGARLLTGLSGLLQTAVRECPALAAQVLLVDADVGVQQLAAQLRAEMRADPPVLVRYLRKASDTGDTREVAAWEPFPDVVGGALPAFNEHGVYLITGGLGGLGMLFAREILASTSAARVVLTGRAEPCAQIDAKLHALASDAVTRARVTYQRMDLLDPDSVRHTVQQTVAGHGRLHGVLHAAGMLHDGLLAHKSAQTFASVLAPKVRGTANLDHATAQLDLDLFILFSSGAAVMGSPGQADYAAANGFLDAFACYRDELAATGARHGRTLSVNWPLWADGGMRMPEHRREMLREVAGMLPLATTAGMAAFHRSLASPYPRTLVLEGELTKIRHTLFGEPLRWGAAGAAVGTGKGADRAVPASGASPAGADTDSPVAGVLADQTRDYLRKQFAELFGMPYYKIDVQAPLEKYGIDSILAMDLTGQLEKSFGPLSKTLFFEYRSIDELTGYFMREHAPRLADLFAADQPMPVPALATTPTSGPTAASAAAPSIVSAAFRQRLARVPVRAARDEPIAVVGLSGRYPQAPDLDAYWCNLREGRDCIVEIPRERWDWRDYYSAQPTQEGAHFSKWGGFIDGVDEFDPLFFNIPPIDAELIDPQERLFLQHVWMAIEDAGYTRASLQIPHEDDLPGQVGVYAGVMYGEYQLFGAEASVAGRRIGVPVSYASIANRVSYLLNLHGPSLTLDSMCSSSLTAIHLACQDLKAGRTSLAIAGGVNVTIHPNKYLILSAGRYISGDGHCQSFGEGGDGYIPGEGVGVVVLKRLSEAERDGNPIHGLLRGSALNHGGKTHGYSVPNPKAQASVIRHALRNSGVDPRRVSYIEAHGTGTKLGDPIEIAALIEVFRESTDARQICAIGSAKSNIGHCESAAGIAGLTKVLLQMRHRQIVPSLHSAVLNPHIDFDASPFVVNQRLREWDTLADGARGLPRVAGISSFGAGGSNAHLIVEEYQAGEPVPADVPRRPALVPLSARTRMQLLQKARDLLAYLEKSFEQNADQGAEQGVKQPVAHARTAVDLTALAYTLQVGREAMDVRIAFLADSLDMLLAALRAYCNGERQIDGCFDTPDAASAQTRDEFAALGQDEDMIATLDTWIARGKFARLAEIWVKGCSIDWRKLYGARTPRLLSLPTYPFAKERYWIGRESGAAGRRVPETVRLHPLLHTNGSDLFQQRYTSRFTGGEAFLADHQIDAAGGACKVLPAAVYLEMVRAAIDLALPVSAKPAAWDLRSLAWVAPLVVERTVQVTVDLTVGAGGRIDFEVHSDAGEARTVHCHGHALSLADAGVPALDLVTLGERMSVRAEAQQRTAGELYDALAAMGIHYGPSMRSVAGLACRTGEVLAELVAPFSPDSALLLLPELFDGALQASLGLTGDWTCLPDSPAVPFALDSLAVLGPCPSRMFAWVRRAAHAQPAEGITKLDVDLCDADGRVRVCARGIALRGWRDSASEGALIAYPVWEDLAPDQPAESGAAAHRQVVLCDLLVVDAARLAVELTGSVAEQRALPEPAHVADRYRAAALACFGHLRNLLAHGGAGPLLYQLVIGGAGDDGDALLAGLSGLLETARREQPRLRAQLVLTSRTVDTDTLAAQLEQARCAPHECLLRFGSGAASVPGVRRWRAKPLGDAPGFALRERGVYLITGGLGGLGRLFAREILSRAPGAVVVLSGRAELDDARRVQMQALAEELPFSVERLVYRRVDLSNATEVDALIAGIVREFGALDGVLHCAGMLNDGLIVNKTETDFADVLEPKVAGTLNLDHATQYVGLAFFVLFSSVAAAFGNAGQADYAAANGFLDCFAARRNRLVAAGERRGRTLSIGWPLWRDGGMRLDAEAVERLAEVSGMRPMPGATGLRAFWQALAGEAAHAVVLAGDVRRLQRLLDARADTAPQGPQVSLPLPTMQPDTPEALREQATVFVAGQFAALLKLARQDVDSHAPLEKYGVDSVLAMKFTQELERRFGTLSKTLLFEYQTLAALANYLADTFPQIVRECAGSAPAGVRDEAPDASTALQPASLSPRYRFAAAYTAPYAARDDAVAIVGVAGRYPQADDLRTFWRNLRDGLDCIREVPPQRWDHARVFDPRRNQPGKTYSRWGGFLNDVDRFDALFFGISPREAELLDPQERLFLETAWETLEDAGYGKDGFAGQRVGVYVGAMWGQYELYGVNAAHASVPSSSFASIANRVSYFFDFHGPSLALDSMCSSSASALHLAAEAVRNGTVDAALAGGVNVTIHPSKYLLLSQGGFASSDGRCRSFGAGGDGYVPGEGVGAVLLKPLARALSDGDHIYAVVKASELNHGGKTNGYTVPNPVAQAGLIHDTLVKARLAPHEIDYVETHGTGTSLGDPIEINGLTRAFAQAAGATPLARGACAIGSVKSNIGHLESAAGIAAVTKVLLQFRHRKIVPSLHAQPLNPHIDFDATPFRVQTTLADWPQHADRPMRACVSSFGAGGANAHLILESFEDTRAPLADARPEAFVLSARDRVSLRAYAHRMLAFNADGDNELAWADIAYTSQVGRTPMPVRLVVIAAHADAFGHALAQWLDYADGGGTALPPNVYEGDVRDAQAVASVLIDGDAGAAFLDVALRQRDLAKLARLWVAGVEIDWAQLHEPSRVRRVSLPTYPFAKERYWIEAAATVPSVPQESAAATAAQPQLLHYHPIWRAAELGAGADAGAARVLIVEADGAFASAFAATFARAGYTPILATSGPAYCELGADRYTFDPANDADVARLVDTLRQREQLPHVIVHRPAADGTLGQQLESSVFTLHALCKVLMRDKTQDPVRIVSLRIGAEDMPLHDAMSGYLRSLALEAPRFAGKTLVLAASVAPEIAAHYVHEELRDPIWRDVEIRYTTSCEGIATTLHREVRRIEPSVAEQIPEAAVASEPGAALRHGGVYLVTGGLGGLGYALSEHLVKTCRARLVLTGRSAPDAALEHKLTQLREQGGEAIYVQADLADLVQTQALVAAAKRRFVRLDGVIHSAGVHRDAFALHKTRADMNSVFAAKIHGTGNLDLATADEPLDLFVLFSSIAGVIGNPGQCDYAYANRFIDSFAQMRATRVRAGTRHGKTLSVSWPLWEAGGMRLSPAEIELLRARTGLVPLPTAFGLRSLERYLNGNDVQAIALFGEPARIGALLNGSSAPRAATTAEDRSAGPANATLEQTAIAYLKRRLGEQIKLAAERIDEHERFDAYGVDSIIANQLNAVLESDLGALPKTLFYEYPSIGELAAFLLDHARGALQRLLAQEVQQVDAADITLGSADTSDTSGSTDAVHLRAPASPAHADAVRSSSDEKIAIVGIDGQFPGSADLAALWENLRAGRDLVREVPVERWDAAAAYDADPDAAERGKIYGRWGGFLDDADAFDAAFFGIAPADAVMIDPQERLFLQSVWHAFEDAGYTRDTLKRRHPKGHGAAVGVFCGVTTQSYLTRAPSEGSRGNMSIPASMPWSIANRVSYVFDFHGPSMPVDTACSSSLVALHLATESLRRGECELAVAGGVNLYLHPSKYYSLCCRRMLARGPRCCSFGAGDDGFVPGEGVGAVVLKPLSRALADGDTIHGVIAASGYAHGGRANGYTAPNPNAQAQLIIATLQLAGLGAEAIGYVEGHGTGTQLGDSLEIAALTRAFGVDTGRTQFCALGSVKSNLGHAESAAGMAGIAKILLQFKHRQLAPTLHAHEANPDIDFAATPFSLQHELADWSAPDGAPRRALINAFGAGGVNACVILEEHIPAPAAPQCSGTAQLIVLSARNEARLRECAGRLRERLLADPYLPLDALAYTLQNGREAMEARLAIVATGRDSLLAELALAQAGSPLTEALQGRVEPHRRKQGTQPEERAHLLALHSSGELRALAQCWVDGQTLDWDDFAGPGQARRLSLPGYPFEKTRHRLPETSARPLAADLPAALHPLVTENASTLREVSFASWLSADAWYACDHQVHGARLFPATGFIEIACVAGTLAGEQSVSALEEIVWHRPLPLKGSRQLVKTLFRESGDDADFVIVSLDDDNERVVHAEGRVRYAARGGAGHGRESAGATVPLDALREQATTLLPGEACYQQFTHFGLHYGPGFRTIETMHIGDGFALSALRIPAACTADFERYLLHPSLLDGALQTVFGLISGAGPALAHVPFALGSVERMRPLPTFCYAYARAHDCAPGGVRLFDIQLLNPRGEVLATLRRLHLRALVPNPPQPALTAQALADTMRVPATD